MSAAAAEQAPEQAYVQFRTPRAYEWMLRIGDGRGQPILFVPPLFEELNRTRALIVAVMRRLAGDGCGCWLPDLSGTNESLLDLESVSLDDWRHDVIAAAAFVEGTSGRRPIVASVRGGVLVDHGVQAAGWWRFAPVRGAALTRDLDRAAIAGGADWAGYTASQVLRGALAATDATKVTPLRSVRLETEAAEADAKVDGPALWRRSEPGTSAALADTLAVDLLEWSRTCAGS